jgi:hypothetical protein
MKLEDSKAEDKAETALVLGYRYLGIILIRFLGVLLPILTVTDFCG